MATANVRQGNGFQLVGWEDVAGRLSNVTKQMYTTPEMTRVMYAGSKAVQMHARRNAPENRGAHSVIWGKYRYKEDRTTGKTLRESIRAFRLTRMQRVYGPGAMAMVNVSRSVRRSRVRAPHAHLVEFGSRMRVPKKAKYMFFPGRQAPLTFRKRVRGMPASPYFEKAIDSSGRLALRRIERAAQKITDAALKKAAKVAA